MNRSGFLLLETSLSTFVIMTGLIAVLPLMALCVRASKDIVHVKTATQLSVELLEEIRLHKWDELTPSSLQAISLGTATLGPDSGETAADKTTFDDLDDFNGWTESPPQDPTMQSLTALTGYTRSVTVSYVDSNLNASATPTDYKKVHVCTQWLQESPVCLDTLFTNR